MANVLWFTFAASMALGQGVQQNQLPADLYADYVQCWSEPFNVDMVTSLDSLFTQYCPKQEWIMGCRQVGAANLSVFALTSQTSLRASLPTPGVQWYFGRDSSLGFAPEGAGVSLSSCDYDFTSSQTLQNQRFCVQTKLGYISSGFRCGNQTFLNGNSMWERVVFHSDSPTLQPTQAPTLQPTTLQPTSQPTLQPTTLEPTKSPTSWEPTAPPTLEPTASPTLTNQFFPGVRTDVDPQLYPKWTLCFNDSFGARLITSVDYLFDTLCTGKRLMMACGNTTNWIVAANAPRDDVLFETPQTDTHLANGVEWYFVPSLSFGYAPQGLAVRLDDCDVENEQGDKRMCIHQLDDGGVNYLEFGYRCGLFVGDAVYVYDRLFYHTNDEE
ncbi:hypothetical protein BASA81_003237 [Batrachochytrium salamandrivorans]|nr:hypothetical protein BASA81_003237 [Batrachochytrium salamandrivorans]